ncbi:hypothetical protein ACEWY4_000240 [Coilia grayii]|uniref:Ig-like domain-containing protein n=1 Tax=Coilia grayii TaxID=363190 RepID=A0ABD1KW37_9TELE
MENAGRLLSRMPRILLYILWLYTTKVNAADLGGHSLLAFATYIEGETPFPMFGAVLMLDDIQIGFYSSSGRKLIPRGPMNDKDIGSSNQKNAITVFTVIHENMISQVHKLIHLYNSTHGVQSHQGIFGCDLKASDKPGRMICKEAFNGDSGDETYLSIADKTLETKFKWPGAWTAHQLESVKLMITDLYQPICIGALYDLLNQTRKYVRRKVKPRVRLLQRALPDNGGVKVTCLATGFYPRHINLTLLRDGQPVPDHQITGGELLPNGDGTYQMRKSLEVSTEEVQHHQYTCTAQHLSLDNKLDILLEPRPGQNHVVVAVVMLTLVCLPVFIIFVFCWKRIKGSQKSKEDVKEESEEAPQEEEPLETLSSG